MPERIYFKQLKSLIWEAIVALTKEQATFLFIVDGKLIHECAARASVTLREYNMSGKPREGNGDIGPVSLPNYFKEAGHFAYWIARLKPLRLVNHSIVSETLKRLAIDHDEAALMKQVELNRRRDIVVLLNEYAAYFVARQIIARSERRRFEISTTECSAEEARRREELFYRLRRQATDKAVSLNDYLLHSLRYDTHSPNSLALLFEALLGSNFPFETPATDGRTPAI